MKQRVVVSDEVYGVMRREADSAYDEFLVRTADGDLEMCEFRNIYPKSHTDNR